MTSEKIRQVLDQIDDVLVAGDGDSMRLWDILTALRGPDHIENQRRKESGTVHIRQAAFPKTAKSSQFYYATIVPTEALDTNVMDGDKYEFSHFEGHLQRAFNALDVKAEGV